MAKHRRTDGITAVVPALAELAAEGAQQQALVARVCVECGATKTPQWREGPMGPKTLCNACGVRFQRGKKKAAEAAAAQKRAAAPAAHGMGPGIKSRRVSHNSGHHSHGVTSSNEMSGSMLPAAGRPVASCAVAAGAGAAPAEPTDEGEEGLVELEVAQELLCLAAGSASEDAGDDQVTLPPGLGSSLFLPDAGVEAQEPARRTSARQQQRQLREAAAAAAAEPCMPAPAAAGSLVYDHLEAAGAANLPVACLSTQHTGMPLQLPRQPVAARPSTAASRPAWGPLVVLPQGPASEQLHGPRTMDMDAEPQAAGPSSPTAAGLQADRQLAPSAAGTASPTATQLSGGAAAEVAAEGSSCDAVAHPQQMAAGTAAAAAAAAAAGVPLAQLTPAERQHLVALQQALGQAQAQVLRAEQEQREVFQLLVRAQAEAQLARLQVQQYAHTLQRELATLSLYCLMQQAKREQQQAATAATAAAAGEAAAHVAERAAADVEGPASGGASCAADAEPMAVAAAAAGTASLAAGLVMGGAAAAAAAAAAAPSVMPHTL